MYFALKLYQPLPKGPLLPITTLGGEQSLLSTERLSGSFDSWVSYIRSQGRLEYPVAILQSAARPNPNPAPYLINRQSNVTDAGDSPTCQSVP